MKIEFESDERTAYTLDDMPVGVPFRRAGDTDCPAVYIQVLEQASREIYTVCLTTNEIVANPYHIREVVPLTITATAKDNPEWRPKQ